MHVLFCPVKDSVINSHDKAIDHLQLSFVKDEKSGYSFIVLHVHLSNLISILAGVFRVFYV